jgi:hypothetical protein
LCYRCPALVTNFCIFATEPECQCIAVIHSTFLVLLYSYALCLLGRCSPHRVGCGRQGSAVLESTVDDASGRDLPRREGSTRPLSAADQTVPGAELAPPAVSGPSGPQQLTQRARRMTFPHNQLVILFIGGLATFISNNSKKERKDCAQQG